jgi:2-isopropylmalate synthase
MDIVTMAMNLYSQGVDPQLNLENTDEILQTARECTQLPVHPRHPWVGELVFTAFSGSHQDAIKKCLARRDEAEPWEVAYLPIDPKDIGRSYQEVIRINSQSGKGGIAFVLQRDFGLELPRWLQIDFSRTVQAHAEAQETEVGSAEVFALFEKTYLSSSGRWQLGNYQVSREDGVDKLQAQLQEGSTSHTLIGTGNGVVAAFVDAVQEFTGKNIVLVEYNEHALSQSADAEAICYIQLSVDGNRFCGVGLSPDIVQASLDGILCAINQAAGQEHNAAA